MNQISKHCIRNYVFNLFEKFENYFAQEFFFLFLYFLASHTYD